MRLETVISPPQQVRLLPECIVDLLLSFSASVSRPCNNSDVLHRQHYYNCTVSCDYYRL